MTELF